MRETSFEQFLLHDPKNLTSKAIASRVTRARKAESLLRRDLDSIVTDDNTMFEVLIFLREHEDCTHSPMQNALRKYYSFVRNKDFPQLRYFHQ